MRRRRFLTSLAAAVAAGCTTVGLETTPTTTALPGTGPGGSGGGRSVSGDPTTTAGATTTTGEAAPPPESVDPMPTPASGLGPDGFGLGVASGDPDTTSVVLWTRLVDPPSERVAVAWDVAADAEFTQIVGTGVVEATGAAGHSLHVSAEGLSPDRVWWYRFRSGDAVSTIGRTRTMPTANVGRALRIGVSSCQLMETGQWAAHRDAADHDLDVFVWLGDYIYEGGGSSQLSGRAHEGGTATDLEGYRHRYAQYRRDPLLQAAHAAYPWFVTWDDHEVSNDYDAFVDPARKAAAYQAWWEFVPTRLPAPTGPHHAIYRSLRLGDRVKIVATDVRQYADGATLYGEAQKAWLAAELRHDAAWTLLAHPTVASGIGVGSDEVLLGYTLDGYPHERRWLGEHLADAPAPIIVSGDLHAGAVFEFSPDRSDVNAPVVATEFMAPAISSAFPAQYAAAANLLPLVNGHMKFFETRNGWLLLTFDADEAIAEFHRVDDITAADSAITVRHRWAVKRGDPSPVPLR